MELKTIMGFAVGPLGSAILGVVTLPVLAWIFTPEDIGRIGMLGVASNLAIILFCLGMDQAYVREYHESTPALRPRLLRSAGMPGLLFFVISCSIMLIVLPTFFSRLLFSIESRAFSALIVICLGAGYISRFLSLILRMEEKGLAFSMSQLLPKLLFLLLIGWFASLHERLGFGYLLIAQVVSIGAVTIIYAWTTRKTLFPAMRAKIDRDELASLMRFGTPLILGGFASWALMSMDKVFLRSLSTYSELGVYTIAVSAASAAGIATTVFNTIWTPTVYKWSVEGVEASKIDDISDHMLAVCVAIFLLAGLFSGLLHYILPDDYARVPYLLNACLAVPLFYSLSETTAVGLGLARKSSYSMYASVVAAALCAVGNFLLIPLWGAAGAGIAAASALWIFLLARTELSSRAWRPVPRRRLYVVSGSMLLMSTGYSLTGPSHYTVWLLLWMLATLIAGWSFRQSIVSAIRMCLALSAQAVNGRARKLRAR